MPFRKMIVLKEIFVTLIFYRFFLKNFNLGHSNIDPSKRNSYDLLELGERGI